jgi:hypothetical protein
VHQSSIPIFPRVCRREHSSLGSLFLRSGNTLRCNPDSKRWVWWEYRWHQAAEIDLGGTRPGREQGARKPKKRAQIADVDIFAAKEKDPSGLYTILHLDSAMADVHTVADTLRRVNFGNRRREIAPDLHRRSRIARKPYPTM